MRVIQRERVLARDLLQPGTFQIIQPFAQQSQPGVQGLAECALFQHEDIDDAIPPVAQFRIVRRHQAYHRVGSVAQEGLFQAKPLAITHRAPQDAPENVASPFIAGQDPIASQKDERPPMVGDDAQGHIGLGILAICCDLRNFLMMGAKRSVHTGQEP